MTALPPPRGAFGRGGTEPWARVLRDGGGALWLEDEDGARDALDSARWAGTADDADRLALAGLDGPVLDIGCGPGRMVRAALDERLPALGIDVSAAAIRTCRAAGLPVLRRDVFGAVPRPGTWAAALLLDGNIGIGGDVPALLARCHALLAPGGLLLAEVHAEPARDDRGTRRVVDAAGRASAPFRWAEAGEATLVAASLRDFEVDVAWTAGTRRFVRLRAA